MPLDKLIGLWKQFVSTAAEKQWLANFSRRYLDLYASEAEFLAEKARN